MLKNNSKIHLGDLKMELFSVPGFV